MYTYIYMTGMELELIEKLKVMPVCNIIYPQETCRRRHQTAVINFVRKRNRCGIVIQYNT